MTLIENYNVDPNAAVGSDLNAQGSEPSTSSSDRAGTDDDSVNNPGRSRTNAREQTAPRFENNSSGTSGNNNQNRSSYKPIKQ
ncbi:MAG: hypothetical protein HC890_10045 [Chloroflexaceae bacterium]|nr:hypothetical protein [Chloroflexaceae bacterium]